MKTYMKVLGIIIVILISLILLKFLNIIVGISFFVICVGLLVYYGFIRKSLVLNKYIPIMLDIPLLNNIYIEKNNNTIVLVQPISEYNKNNEFYCKEKNIDFLSFSIDKNIWQYINSILKHLKYEYVIYLASNMNIIDFNKDFRRIIQQGGDNEMILCRDEYDKSNINLDAIIFRDSEWTSYKLKQLYNKELENKIDYYVIMDQIYTDYNLNIKNFSNSLDIGIPFLLSGICVYNEHVFNSCKSSFIKKEHSCKSSQIHQIIEIYPWKKVEGYIEINKNLENLPQHDYDPKQHNGRKIPKYIFQTMETTLISNNMNKYSRNLLIEMNPEYKYFYFDALDCRKFIKSNFEDYVFKAYDMLLPGAFKADFWRYCALYVYGGVYCDSRVMPIKNFDSFIDNDKDFFIPNDVCNGLWQGFFGIKPKCELLKMTIKYSSIDILSCKYNPYFSTCSIRLSITGPGRISTSFNIFLGKHTYSNHNIGNYIVDNFNYKILDFCQDNNKNNPHPYITDSKTQVMCYKYSEIFNKTNVDLTKELSDLTGKEHYNRAYDRKKVFKYNSINYIPLIWSRGWCSLMLMNNPFFTYEYMDLPTENVLCINKLIQYFTNIKKYVWIRTGSFTNNDVDNFSKYVLPNLKNPVILITTDGDLKIPSGLNTNTVTNILSSDNITAWYTQNYDNTVNHKKLFAIPIGMDLHSHNKSPIDTYYRINLLPVNQTKIFKVFCDTNLNLNSIDRKNLYNSLKNNPNVYFLENKVSHNKILEQYSKYKFVCSPKGNGLDCHRTWEALYMGSIVITCTKQLSSLFTELPVVVIDNWDEISTENLIKWDKHYSKYIINSREKLEDLEYWVNKHK